MKSTTFLSILILLAFVANIKCEKVNLTSMSKDDLADLERKLNDEPNSGRERTDQEVNEMITKMKFWLRNGLRE